MLNQDTKRKIDSARQILVGKVPDPKAQVEQITTALIYKFMDDMDKEAQELGGKARFFTNGYEKYAWTKLMDAKLGGHDRLDLYIEAITSLSQNPHIPQLFRDIFKDTFLPYRNPETLSLFLKEVNGFSYDNSEDLGNAFEYLLSILGSQGDAGQFRTPRHIIDFIVAAVNPKKDETICDPACGTAGFLISAYKHILKQHDGIDDPENKEKPLTPDERKTLMDHFAGYDISPDMVRLSKVNLYLHGFPSPTIFEYDTLSSEEKWDESFDVMLANPPFMSPKGGIKPHKRFSVQAKRSEVLFVDYILEHLRPRGRAGIIVPEGIIFQSAGAYKQLRKMLVEDGLMAVVSLPAGVFNPYAGVKTSILLFDNEIAKKTKNILFLKIQNDGYDLGAQRREHSKNDLPLTLKVIKKYKQALKDGGNFEFSESEKQIAHLVAKDKIAESGDYNLSGDRYKEVINFANQKWPMVELCEVCEILNGYAFKSENYVNNGVRVIRITNVQNGEIVDDNPKFYPLNTKEPIEKYKLIEDDLLISLTGNVGRVGLLPKGFLPAGLNQRVACLRVDEHKISKKFLFRILNQSKFEQECIKSASGMAQKNMSTIWLAKHKIPLPPIEVQGKIVEQIEKYQNIVDGAKQVVVNWKPKVSIDPDWPIENLSDVCTQITDGTHQTPKYTKEGVPFLRVTDITESNESKKYLSEEEHQELVKRCKPEKGDVLYTKNGTIGIAKMVDWDYEFSIFVSLALLKPKKEILEGKYLEHYLNSELALAQAKAHSKSGTVTNLHLIEIKQFKIPLPPLEIQKQIVAEIEEEQKIIEANKKLIVIMEHKIADVLSEI